MPDNRPSAASTSKRGGALLALAFVPLLGGCVGLVGIPLIAGTGVLTTHIRHVRAATKVPKTSRSGKLPTSQELRARNASRSAKAKTPPLATSALAPDDPWQRFFTYTMKQAEPAPGIVSPPQSALLVQPPALDMPVRTQCDQSEPPAVIIDLDVGSAPFAPDQLPQAPAGVAAGLAQLRLAGVEVLWISGLPAARVVDVAKALRTSGYDPEGRDQFLLLRAPQDRKQLLRENASDDVCIVAVAGDARGDFDELFDYLRVPGSAAGLDSMLGEGWFLVPPLTAPAGGAK